MSMRYAMLFAAAALVACGGDAGQQEAAPPAEAPAAETPPAAQMGTLPEGVTQAMVDNGRGIYHAGGICYTCHGQNGVGVQGLGPALNDAEWLHSDGSYDAIVNQINVGVTAAQSTTGTIMPPKGGAVTLTDDEVRAIGAYVYSLRGN